MRLLLLPFILVPVLELMVLIKVGSVIGALNTIILLFLGGFVGLQVIRRQGLRGMMKTQQKMAAGELPAKEVLETFLLAIAGLLLIIPGFITDFAAVFLLIPPVRHLLLKRIVARGHWKVQNTDVYEGEWRREPQRGSDPQKIKSTIDGEYTRDDSHDK